MKVDVFTMFLLALMIKKIMNIFYVFIMPTGQFSKLENWWSYMYIFFNKVYTLIEAEKVLYYLYCFKYDYYSLILKYVQNNIVFTSQSLLEVGAIIITSSFLLIIVVCRINGIVGNVQSQSIKQGDLMSKPCHNADSLVSGFCLLDIRLQISHLIIVLPILYHLLENSFIIVGFCYRCYLSGLEYWVVYI